MSQKTAKRLFYIFGSIFLFCVIFVGVAVYIVNNPALLPSFPVYQNSTKLDLRFPLDDPENYELLGNYCEGNNFSARDLQAYAINSDRESLLTFYRDFAGNNAMETHAGDPSLNGVGVTSTCFEGPFNRKHPTNVVNVLDIKTQADKISQLFKKVPSDSTFVVVVIRGYILYI